MSWVGDFRLGDTFDTKFTTRQISGAPTTLAGSPVISAYVGNSTTEITAGITLTVDFDSRTGLNNVRVVATSGNGYATASNYQLVITTGTVNSVSVVSEVIAEFSIEARSALMPTVAARTLDVSATGEGGVDWGNVGSPTTTNGLSGTTVGTLTTYTGNTPQTGDSFARIGAPVGASISADIAGVAGSAWDIVLGSHLTPGSTGAALNAAGAAGDPWTTAIPGAYAVGTAGFIVGNQLPELYKIHGLQTGTPLTVTPTSRIAGTISQVVATTGSGSTERTTVTR